MSSPQETLPRTSLEAALVSIWCEVLHREGLSIDDDVFACGGDSIRAAQALAHLEGFLGHEVPLQMVFDFPTTRELAREIERQRDRLSAPRLPLMARPAAVDAPLSFAQQRLWFLEQLLPGTPTYIVAYTARVRGVLRIRALERALQCVVDQHAVFRTAFLVRDGEPRQSIRPDGVAKIPVVDLTQVAHRESVLSRVLQAEGARPFILGEPPLIRSLLLMLARDEYIWLLTTHHIVVDAWSMALLLEEIEAAYRAVVSGNASRGQTLTLTYADYAAWQRQSFTDEALADGLAYWKQQLHGVQDHLQLPLDRGRQPLRVAVGATWLCRLSASDVAAVKAAGQRYQATLYMVLLGCLAVLLQRYTGQSDILVGSPISMRRSRHVHGLIGFFVNTLALRVQVDESQTFGELLRKVRATVLEAYRHQDVPFERVVEAVAPARSLARAPLFQVVLDVNSGPRAMRPDLVDLVVEPLANDAEYVRNDLEIHVFESESGMEVQWLYDRHLFDGWRIEQMGGHFADLLMQMVRQPTLVVGAVSLTGGAALHGPEKGPGDPDFVPIHECIERISMTLPDAIALTDGATQVSYGELDRRANRLARYLLRLGARTEARVGICFGRSTELFVALLATLKAGAVYIPLDPDAPLERLARMIEGSGMQVLLTSVEVAQRLPAVHPQFAMLNDAQARWTHESCERLATNVDPDNLAYIVYTSGSTGEPKGVCVTQRGVRNLGYGLAEKYAIGQADVMLQFAAPGFDALTTEWAISFLSGARIAIPSSEQALPGRGLEEFIDRFAVSIATIPPAVLSQMRPGRYPTLRTLAVAGEACRAELLGSWCDGRRFLNAYGPTEITVCASISAPLSVAVDIGRPIANTRLYVLDAMGQLVPTGVVGELYVGGAGVARGYLDSPGTTAGKFVPDPYGGHPGARLYRTGDLVRALADGRLEFIGRVDDQLKIRGCRVEPGEVCAVLASHPAVERAVVLPAKDTQGQSQLAAYVIKTAPCTAAELVAFTQDRLPAYMVPARVQFVETFPLTAHGKIDRHALSALETVQEAVTPRPPRTVLESIVCEVWAAVLKRDHVWVDQGFFALGGHSLLAAQAAARLERLLQRRVGVAMFFQYSTAEQFAAALERDPDEPQAAGMPLSRRGGADEVLSFEQQRLWFLDRLTPNKAFYVVPYAVRLQGDLSVAALSRAVRKLVERHAILRTAFLRERGQPRQVIRAGVSIGTPVVDLSGVDERRRELVLRRIVSSASTRPFDLANAPLLRSMLIRLAPQTHVWALTMHHIVSDAWSMTVLARDISALYESVLQGAAAEPAPLPVQYGDYAAWQSARSSGAAFESHSTYWQEKLAGVAPLNLATDRPRPHIADHSGGAVRASLSATTTAALREIAEESAVTFFMVLLTAWQVLLARYSGQTDIVVGTPVANRRAPELEDLIGFFVSTLVMRTDLGGNPTLREAMRRVRETAVQAYRHQDAPFELLVEKLQPERDLSRNPLFQVLLQVHEARIESLRLRNVSATPFELEATTTRFDLELHASADAGGFQLELIYSRSLFEARTAARILGHYLKVLETMLSDCDRRIEDIVLLSVSERQQVLGSWNETGCSWSAGGKSWGLSELVLAQALSTPDRVAMVAAGEHLTYAALTSRAKSVAGSLFELGVGPDGRVGVCVPRGLGVGIGILGTMFAGAAYIPLDPAYPRARLAAMAQDAALAAIVTEGDTAHRVRLTGSSAVIDIAARGLPPWRDVERVRVCSPPPECLAYIIYTSGSTGVPKGIGLPHAALVNLLHWYGTQLPPGQRTLQLASISFDASFHELFHCWTSGGTVVCVDEDAPRDVASLARVIDMEAIEKVVAPALLLAPLTKRLGAGGRSITDVVCTAEPLQVSPAVTEWFTTHGARLHNHYGPSETHVVTAQVCAGPPAKWPAMVPIGRPIANTQVYVLDARGQPAPIGVVGELFIGGVSLARGYWGQAGLTAERFVPDPFGVAGARLYRTGDRVRYHSNGELEFLGRSDHQVKIRGFRVEPTEIESVLAKQPGVAATVVLSREDRPGELRLVAYIVPEHAHAPPTIERLREDLGRILPTYMVPAAFVVLPSLPLAPSGKVDRMRLPAPDDGRPALATSFIAPRTGAECALAALWSELLRVERIGIDDDFFDLGGHSLLASQVVNRIEELFAAPLPLREVFERRTVRRLADLLPDETEGLWMRAAQN